MSVATADRNIKTDCAYTPFNMSNIIHAILASAWAVDDGSVYVYIVTSWHILAQWKTHIRSKWVVPSSMQQHWRNGHTPNNYNTVEGSRNSDKIRCIRNSSKNCSKLTCTVTLYANTDRPNIAVWWICSAIACLNAIRQDSGCSLSPVVLCVSTIFVVDY